MQNRMRKLKLTVNTNPDPNRYRRHCPDPNARIQKFIHYMAIAAICDSGLSHAIDNIVYLVLVVSMYVCMYVCMHVCIVSLISTAS